MVHGALQELAEVDAEIIVEVQLAHYQLSLTGISRKSIARQELEQAMIFESFLKFL